jgi:transposase
MKVLSHIRPEEILPEAMKNPAQVLFIGIDISSKDHVVRAVLGNKNHLKDKFIFSSSYDDLIHFCEWVHQFKKRYNANHVFIGLEPTGQYWMPVYEFLRDNLPESGTYEVASRAVSWYRKMKNSNSSKTDPGDAYSIAELVATGNCCRPIQHTSLTKNLRETIRLYDEATTRLLQARQQLMAMVQKSFPEALSSVSSPGGIDGIFKILKDSINPKDITKVSQEQWVELKVRKGVARKKLRNLYFLAQYSLGQIDNEKYRNILWEIQWKSWKNTLQRCDDLKNILKEIIDLHEVTPYLLTIDGIATITIAAFLAGIGDINQYSSEKQIEKVFGFDFFRWQSGKMDCQPHITKHGYSIGRKYLVLAGERFIKYPEPNEWYNRRIKKTKDGKPGMSGVIALTAKLIRIMFAVAKFKKPYDASLAFKSQCRARVIENSPFAASRKLAFTG